MKRIRRMLEGRRLFLTFALAIVAMGVFVSTLPTAEAIIGPGVCSYYSNATYKKVVGARGTGCCGTTINWGITTKYVRCEELLCPDVECGI